MKKLLISIGAILTLLLLVVVGLAAYVLTFDPNEHKEWIADNFRESTGRELVLGGDVEWTLYPWLGITANDVSVGNAPGFSATPLVQAQHLAARIKLMPLLGGEYEIDTVRLLGAHVNLEVRGDGTNNWTLGDAGAGAEADEADAESDAGFSVPNFVIGGVDIQDAALTYDDQQTNTHYEVSNFDVAIGELVYGAPLDVRLNFDAASRTPELDVAANVTGTVLYDVDNGRYDLEPLVLAATLRGPNVPNGSADIDLTTALTVNLDDDTLSLRELQLDALDTQVSAGLEAARISSDAPAVNGNLNVRGNDLAVIFRILEQQELAQRIGALSGSFTVDATLDADMQSGAVNIPALQANLLGADISGTLSASRVNSDAPAVSGNLNASGPDLPTLVEVLGILQGGSSGELTRIGRDLARVPDKTFRVQADFDADMQSGTLDVPELYVAVVGATITGSVAGTRIQTETPQLRGQLNAQGPDLPLLMMIAGQLTGGQDAALNQTGQQLRQGVRNRAFTLSADFDADMEAGNVQVPALTATMLGFSLDGRLDANGIDDDGNVDGELTLEGDNLREVLAAVGQADLAEVAQSVSVDVQLGGSSDDLRISPLNVELVVAGEQIPNSPQTLALDADTLLNLENDSLQVDAFTLSGLGLNLTGNVSARNIQENVAFDGRVEVPAFDARALLEQLNQPITTADANALTNVALSSQFSGTANSIELDDLALKLDDSNISGTLALTNLETMSGSFSVNIDSIDADRYLNPTAEDAAAETEAPAEPLPVDTLRALNMQGSLNVGALTISGLRMNDIVVQLNAANGNVALNPIRANLYEGSFAGDIALNVADAEPVATVNTQLSTIALGPLLQDFMESQYLTGTANITLALTGRGADSNTIKQSLSGSGDLGVSDGVLQGVDVDAVLRSLEAMIRSRSVQQLPQGGATEFEEFAATLQVNEGIVSSNDLTIRAPGWNITGMGTLANLRNETIDFDLVTTVDETPASDGQPYELGGYSLPIACTGALTGPRCLPDAQQIIASAVTGAVTRRLGELLQDRLGGGTQQQQAPQQDAAPDAEPPADDAPAEQPAEEQRPEEELLDRALDRLLR
ncbi:MAG: AsmA family protein [Gammaproteobacteria bacterium]